MFSNNLDRLLESISGQFGVSVNGIIAFFIGLFAIVLFIVLSWLIQSLLNRRRRKKHSGHIFHSRADKKQLDETQRKLLHELAAFLPDSTLAYLLFRDEAKYNYCARKLLDRNPAAEKDIAALRVVLGLADEVHESLPSSTASLTPGMHITCLKNGRYRPGIITAQEPEGLRISVTFQDRPRIQDRMTVFFTNERGRFQFTGRVNSVGGDSCLLEHSEQIRQSQNRNYFRKVFGGTVELRRIDGDITMMQFSCLDLGGGGLSFVSRDEEFYKGDLLRCNMDPIGRFTLRVVRVSRKGRIVHGEFEEITEQTRDKIFQKLFHAGE
ncbi:MAG: PilZ domain-containing protein [Spirochaetales bacterium]|nr:PilZ domain-containing protein [Spirochaetales bacterium]